MFKLKHGYSMFHLVPGIVILFLSMFVLYLSSNLIERRNNISEEYSTYMVNFLKLEENIHKLIKMCSESLADNSKKGSAGIENGFSELV